MLARASLSTCSSMPVTTGFRDLHHHSKSLAARSAAHLLSHPPDGAFATLAAQLVCPLATYAGLLRTSPGSKHAACAHQAMGMQGPGPRHGGRPWSCSSLPLGGSPRPGGRRRCRTVRLIPAPGHDAQRLLRRHTSWPARANVLALRLPALPQHLVELARIPLLAIGLRRHARAQKPPFALRAGSAAWTLRLRSK